MSTSEYSLDEQLYLFQHEAWTGATRYLELKTNANRLRYVKFFTERQTKMRTGENTRNVRESEQKMYENLDNDDRCPVTTYLAYKQHRPPEMMADDSLFYLAVNTEVRKAGKKWFKAAPLGVNSLRSMVTNMLAASQVHSDKKLVNKKASGPETCG